MEAWMAAGGHDIYARASEKAKSILKNHKPQPLPEDVCKEIRSIIKESEDELGASIEQ
jgi:trimethylamine:corrinoid methyltransferase-like protein